MAPGPIVSGRPGPLSVEPGPIVSGPRGHRQWDPGPSSENHVAIVSESLVFVSAEGPEAVTGLRVVGSPQDKGQPPPRGGGQPSFERALYVETDPWLCHERQAIV